MIALDINHFFCYYSILTNDTIIILDIINVKTRKFWEIFEKDFEFPARFQVDALIFLAVHMAIDGTELYITCTW